MKKFSLVILIVFVSLAIVNCGDSAADLQEKVRTAMQDVKTIGNALESYITDEYKAPEVKTIQELKGVLEGRHIKTMPTVDPWGNPYLYKHGTGDKQDEYFVGCGGSDGNFEGFEQNGTYTDLAGKDIIFGNGNFVFAPAG